MGIEAVLSVPDWEPEALFSLESANPTLPEPDALLLSPFPEPLPSDPDPDPEPLPEPQAAKEQIMTVANRIANFLLILILHFF
jgi:hypothetical protein